MNRKSPSRARGGFVLGAVVGLLIGLVIALGVAMYVTKVPVPFVDRAQHRTPEQDAAEVERNRNWDPNGVLGSKNPLKPGAASAPAPATITGSLGGSGLSGVTPPAGPQSVASKPLIPKPPRDPAAILAGASPAPASSGAASTKPAAEALIYFVQTGAFTRSDEADQQRARLAIEGFSAKVTEREQNGRTLYRVRLGPFDNHEEADSVLEQVKAVAPPATIIRAQRSPS